MSRSILVPPRLPEGQPFVISFENEQFTNSFATPLKKNRRNRQQSRLQGNAWTCRVLPVEPLGARPFGLVAEEVEKIDPELAVRDPQGRPYSVRYDAVNAMLLNEFLKKHRKVAAQESTSRNWK